MDDPWATHGRALSSNGWPVDDPGQAAQQRWPVSPALLSDGSPMGGPYAIHDPAFSGRGQPMG